MAFQYPANATNASSNMCFSGVTSTFVSISTSASAVTDQITTIASLLLMRTNILIEKTVC